MVDDGSIVDPLFVNPQRQNPWIFFTPPKKKRNWSCASKRRSRRCSRATRASRSCWRCCRTRAWVSVSSTRSDRRLRFVDIVFVDGDAEIDVPRTTGLLLLGVPKFRFFFVSFRFCLFSFRFVGFAREHFHRNSIGSCGGKEIVRRGWWNSTSASSF